MSFFIDVIHNVPVVVRVVGDYLSQDPLLLSVFCSHTCSNLEGRKRTSGEERINVQRGGGEEGRKGERRGREEEEGGGGGGRREEEGRKGEKGRKGREKKGEEGGRGERREREKGESLENFGAPSESLIVTDLIRRFTLVLVINRHTATQGGRARGESTRVLILLRYKHKRNMS